MLTPQSNFFQPFTSTFNIEDSYTLADFEIYIFSEGYTPCPTVELRTSFDINTVFKVPDQGEPDPQYFFIFDGVYHIKVELTMRYYYYRYIGPGNNQTRGILPGWIIFKTNAKSLEDLKNLTWNFEDLQTRLFGFGAGDLDKVMSETSFTPDPQTTHGSSYLVSQKDVIIGFGFRLLFIMSMIIACLIVAIMAISFAPNAKYVQLTEKRSFILNIFLEFQVALQIANSIRYTGIGLNWVKLGFSILIWIASDVQLTTHHKQQLK